MGKVFCEWTEVKNLNKAGDNKVAAAINAYNEIEDEMDAVTVLLRSIEAHILNLKHQGKTFQNLQLSGQNCNKMIMGQLGNTIVMLLKVLTA